VNLDTQVD